MTTLTTEVQTHVGLPAMAREPSVRKRVEPLEPIPAPEPDEGCVDGTMDDLGLGWLRVHATVKAGEIIRSMHGDIGIGELRVRLMTAMGVNQAGMLTRGTWDTLGAIALKGEGYHEYANAAGRWYK